VGKKFLGKRLLLKGRDMLLSLIMGRSKNLSDSVEPAI
jgi:hypothetical protein